MELVDLQLKCQSRVQGSVACMMGDSYIFIGFMMKLSMVAVASSPDSPNLFLQVKKAERGTDLLEPQPPCPYACAMEAARLTSCILNRGSCHLCELVRPLQPACLIRFHVCGQFVCSFWVEYRSQLRKHALMEI